METIRAIMRGDLPPAGNRISLSSQNKELDFSLVGFLGKWVDSGTSALALALLDIKKRNPQVINPKVIIPGYCCPDLVAAAVFAGYRPLAVDVQENTPFYQLSILERVIDANTIAVIGVNFLGFRENLEELRLLTSRYGISLIEDNAQWFPDEMYISASDYVIFSFGRGKPLSLLGGGVLFSRGDVLVADFINQVEARESEWKLRLKYLAYNFLLKPQCYAALNRLPFLKLGETRYHPLVRISLMSEFRRSLFFSNYELYKRRRRVLELCYRTLLNHSNMSSLYLSNEYRLLRCPFLCAAVEVRESLYSKFSASGLGASRLYNDSIDCVEGVGLLIEAPFPLENAKSFAKRLLTLPLHESVESAHLSLMERLIRG